MKFGKKYQAEEDKLRYMIFAKSLADVEYQNAKFQKGESSWAAGLNDRSDHTDEENQKRFGLIPDFMAEPMPLPSPALENHYKHHKMF